MQADTPAHASASDPMGGARYGPRSRGRMRTLMVIHETNALTMTCMSAGLAGLVAAFQAGDPVTHAVDRGPATGLTMTTLVPDDHGNCKHVAGLGKT